MTWAMYSFRYRVRGASQNAGGVEVFFEYISYRDILIEKAAMIVLVSAPSVTID